MTTLSFIHKIGFLLGSTQSDSLVRCLRDLFIFERGKEVATFSSHLLCVNVVTGCSPSRAASSLGGIGRKDSTRTLTSSPLAAAGNQQQQQQSQASSVPSSATNVAGSIGKRKSITTAGSSETAAGNSGNGTLPPPTQPPTTTATQPPVTTTGTTSISTTAISNPPLPAGSSQILALTLVRYLRHHLE